MIEVHPPHEKVHSWPQFCIHIAAITIGLLLALGLEQTVEYLHHRHQLEEARRELRIEAEENRRVLSRNFEAVKTITAQLSQNMVLLRATQPWPAQIGSKLVPTDNYAFFVGDDGAWQVAKQNGSLGLMEHDELRRYTYLYGVIAAFQSSLGAFASSANKANAIAHRSPDGMLTAHDGEELITATSETQARINDIDAMLRFAESQLKELQH